MSNCVVARQCYVSCCYYAAKAKQYYVTVLQRQDSTTCHEVIKLSGFSHRMHQ